MGVVLAEVGGILEGLTRITWWEDKQISARDRGLFTSLIQLSQRVPLLGR